MKDQNRVPLAEAVEAQNHLNTVSFHVPGHKGRTKLFGNAESLIGQETIRSDYTEIPGLDALHSPYGAIAEAEKLAADLFGADRTWFLVNGTSSGIAASLAALSTPDDVVLAERACHTSVTSGLVLSGATPYYLEEEYDEEQGLMAGVSVSSVERAFAMCSPVRAIVLTHPSYYGTYSDLRSIVRIAHEHRAAVIVDEAHGAQLPFTGQGIPSAMECGADISVQSTHKMIGSLTQSAMLHMRGDLVDPHRLQFFINMMTTTSPSYPLMVSLDSVRRTMSSDGRRIWERCRERMERAEERIARISGMRCATEYRNAEGRRCRIEQSRLLIDALQLGISGTRLAALLRDQGGIDAEFADPLRAVLVAGSGTSDEDMEQLFRSLERIAASFGKQGDTARTESAGYENTAVTVNESAVRKQAGDLFRIPVHVDMTPRDAVMAPLEILDPEEAVGCVSARDAAVYPPGIPVLRPGERITAEIVEYIIRAREAGLVVHGLVQAPRGFRLAAAQDPRRAMLFSGLY